MSRLLSANLVASNIELNSFIYLHCLLEYIISLFTSFNLICNMPTYNKKLIFYL